MLITKDAYYLDSYGDLRDLSSFSRKYPPYDGYFLSALGARICYSKSSPVEMLFHKEKKDSRILSLDGRKLYLDRIRGMKHFSVFAHSPYTTVKSNKSPIVAYKSYMYAEYYGDETDYYYQLINARHFLEADETLEIQVEEFDLNNPNHKIIFYDKEINSVAIYSLKQFKSYYEYYYENGILSEPENYLLLFAIPINYYGYWISAVAHGYSRVFTHQLVRHTWFNFSQRSFRYTNTFGVRVPNSLKPLFDDPNFECSQSYDRCYWELINEYKAKKEDARYFYPMGAKSTIMFSGPFFVFEDFVEKRAIKAAQQEIREVAQWLQIYIEYLRGFLDGLEK